MDYGATAYENAPKTQLQKLDTLQGCWEFLQDNTYTCPVGRKHYSNPRTKKNTDDRKRDDEERIVEHTSRHDNQKIA
jgi:hypothetical protein